MRTLFRPLSALALVALAVLRRYRVSVGFRLPMPGVSCLRLVPEPG